MSKAWIQAKHPEFVRDLFKFFCQASEQLEKLFVQFDDDGTMSFNALADLVGAEMNKGLLWRMKDTAHHVFRNDPHSQLGGKFLDWALGYIFHEALKLKEDAYQKQNYAPWFHKLHEGELSESEKEITEQLFQILNQTEESMRREIDRIRFIIARCRQLLPYYLNRYSDNALLARYIFSQNELVKSVFASEYDNLLADIYKDKPERMFLLASRSLRAGGWIEEAANAIDQAISVNPDSKMVLQEKKIIDKWQSSTQN